jgi:hypothetical protein
LGKRKGEFVERTPVNSSNIKSVGYDPIRKVLEVEFKTGSVHQYEDVPHDLPEKMVKADSVGRFFNQHVKNRFKSSRLGA